MKKDDYKNESMKKFPAEQPALITSKTVARTSYIYELRDAEARRFKINNRRT